MISLRSALLAYAVLAVIAMVTLKGRMLVLAAVLVAAMVLKTLLAHWSRRI